MVPAVIARMVLRQVLGRPEVKKRVIEALRQAAQKTETKFDDAAVDAFEDIWSVTVPVLLGKL